MIKLPQNLKNKWHAVTAKYHRLPLKTKLAAAASLILIVAAGLLIPGGEEVSGSNQEAANLQKLTENIRRHYQNRPDYWGLNTKAIIDNKTAPLAMLKNGRIVSGFDTDILVGTAPDGLMLMPGSRSFDIIYKGLNKKQCLELTTQKFEEKFWLGVINITISNDNVQEVFSWNDQKNMLPIKKAAAKEICKSVNDIIFHIE